MKSWKLLMLCSAVSLTACQGKTQWSDVQGVPDGFKDGQDDVRSDADVRAIAHDEATQVATALDAKLVSVEADPMYAASAAAHITQEQVAAWDAQAATGDHRTAGYLTAENDPAFAASAAASIAAGDVANWNATHAWGNHATAGYLKSESDPAFTASAASTITTTDVTNWDKAFGWGDHSKAGYLKTESDPKVGALTANTVPMWNGTKLVDTVITQTNGNVAIATGSQTAQLTVTSVAKFGTQISTNTTKSCGMSGFNWTNTPPSGTACAAYCTTRGFASGTVVPTGSKSCGGASCDYISDFETCTTAVMQNNGNCNSCASAFVCTCTNPGTELTGDVRVTSGNVGIGVSVPNSPLQLGGYLQLATTTGAPPATDCDAANERGRMKTDPATGALWVCANSGWVSK